MKKLIAPEGAVSVDSIGYEITVAEFYREVTFERQGTEGLASVSQ